jgi:hypothetical protein
MRLGIRDWEVEVNWPKQRPEQVFVRFGMWDTRANASFNWNTLSGEAGLSVYRGVLSDDLIVSVAEREDVSPLVAGRFAFAVTGRVVGVGSDGEPLLKGVRVLPYALAVNVGRPPHTKETEEG